MHKKHTTIVNVFGPPGAGKSTICAGIFCELKTRGIDCEMSLEYAKDWIYDEAPHILKNQFFIFGNQLQRLWRLHGKVDYIITDSPLLNSIIYDAKNDTDFTNIILKEHKKFVNENFYVKRMAPYSSNGRIQNEYESITIGEQILDMFFEHDIQHTVIDGDKYAVNFIVDKLLIGI